MKKNISSLLSIVVLISGLLVPILLPYSYSGIDNTVRSIKFPNDFIEYDINSTEPWFKYSYFIKNLNLFPLDLHLQASIAIQYYPEYENNTTQSIIFSDSSQFFPISADQSFFIYINATTEKFNVPTLQNIFDTINASKPFSYLLSAHFQGNYLNNLINFQVSFSSLNVSDLEFHF